MMTIDKILHTMHGGRSRKLRPLCFLFAFVFFASLGCLAADLDTRVGTVESKVGSVEAQIGLISSKIGDGNTINEPITGWILAVGYALIPIAFFLYTVAHRFKAFRKIKGAVRGETCL